MHGKKSFLALSTAFAALFVGCEWTGTSESDSWSSAYDAMNFSGTYRAVTTATQLSDTKEDTTEITDTSFATVQENGGPFGTGKNIASGKTSYANLVPGSFSATVGDYVWNDNGSGSLVFTNPNSGASTTDDTDKSIKIGGEVGPTTSSKVDYTWDLLGGKANNVTPKSVTVALDGATSFLDDGAGALVPQGLSGSGTVNYESGTVSVHFNAPPGSGKVLTVSYTYTPKSEAISSNLSGSGTIQYSSGAWTLQINPVMDKDNAGTVTVRYSYYIQNSSSTATHTTITTTTGSEVSALTVAQNGQNLTITLNNGVVMTGKFTNVQQTGKVNQDTNAGYNTYNAQFQVQTTDNKFVGSLNYDLQNGYRMMNGTWTWGKSSYDVQAVGPAWLNSADQSTLSPGVITK